MKVEKFELSRPLKFVITEEAEKVKELKKKAYNSIKNTLPTVQGYRRGHIPQDLAEKKFGVSKLYEKIIDEIYLDIEKEHNIVSSRDFKYYGNFQDGKPLRIEFIAEVEPKVKLRDLENIKIEHEEDISIDEEEINEALEKARSEKKSLKEETKGFLENLDVAILDFEGTLEGDSEPFKGGSAKNFELEIDVENKKFIDNFEEQILGMKKDEVKNINVKFPDDYRDESKQGRKVNFKVILKSINKRIYPELDDDFAKMKGFETLDEYKIFINENLKENKIRENNDEFKKKIMTELLKEAEIGPIPLDMLRNELGRQWRSFLARVGKTEEEYLKEDKDGKEKFFISRSDDSESIIKANLVLQEVARKYSIDINKDEVNQYVENVSGALKKSKDKIEKLIDDMKKNKIQYRVMENAALSEKVVDFLTNYFKK